MASISNIRREGIRIITKSKTQYKDGRKRCVSYHEKYRPGGKNRTVIENVNIKAAVAATSTTLTRMKPALNSDDNIIHSSLGNLSSSVILKTKPRLQNMMDDILPTYEHPSTFLSSSSEEPASTTSFSYAELRLHMSRIQLKRSNREFNSQYKQHFFYTEPNLNIQGILIGPEQNRKEAQISGEMIGFIDDLGRFVLELHENYVENKKYKPDKEINKAYAQTLSKSLHQIIFNIFNNT